MFDMSRRASMVSENREIWMMPSRLRRRYMEEMASFVYR